MRSPNALTMFETMALIDELEKGFRIREERLRPLFKKFFDKPIINLEERQVIIDAMLDLREATTNAIEIAELKRTYTMPPPPPKHIQAMIRARRNRGKKK